MHDAKTDNYTKNQMWQSSILGQMLGSRYLDQESGRKSIPIHLSVQHLYRTNEITELTGVQIHLSSWFTAEHFGDVLQCVLADSRRRQLHRVAAVKEAGPRWVQPHAVVNCRLFLAVGVRIFQHLAVTCQLRLQQYEVTVWACTQHQWTDWHIGQGRPFYW